jgi:hypothetical protein
MKRLCIAFALASLGGCGLESVGTAATGAAIKKQELEQGKKQMEQAQQKIEQSLQLQEQRAASATEEK